MLICQNSKHVLQKLLKNYKKRNRILVHLNVVTEVKGGPCMGAEKKIETKIRKFLKNQGYKTYKIHVGQYGPRGFPDLIVVKDGVTSFLEIKDVNEFPTPIQELRIEELRNYGCIAGPVRSIADVCNFLNLRRTFYE